jgi:PadR family transcriptional regulator PadR
MEENPERTSPPLGEESRVLGHGETMTSRSSALAFDGCPCTGRNLDKFTAPAALLAIAQAGRASGYSVVARIRELPLSGGTGVDHSAVYRALRKMEQTGMVVSSWELGSGGPARRVYTLTESGHRCLDTWAETLARHSRAIKGFLKEHQALRNQ